MTANGHMTYAQLTAAYLYSDHVFDSAKVVCEQAASVLENVGTVDTVLKCAALTILTVHPLLWAHVIDVQCMPALMPCNPSQVQDCITVMSGWIFCARMLFAAMQVVEA